MEALVRELRQSFRMFARSRGFTGVAVLTLALGIRAATAIFSVVEPVLLRALPYPNPQTIVRVWEQAPDGHRMNLADPNFEDFRRQNNTFAHLAEYAFWVSSLAGGSEPVRATVCEVGGGFFASFGVQPVRGRGFVPDESRIHGAPAAIVSYRYWQRYLAGATDLSRRQIRAEGEVFPIVGVMPESFDFPAGTAAWIPRTFEPDTDRTAHNWNGLGRLRAGVSVAQARANLSTIARRIKEQYGKDANLNAAAVTPLADAIVGKVRTALLTLMSAVGLLLLVACANVAGLLVARMSTRRKELAVRAALGAGRWRLMGQFLAESCVLSTAGGALGVAIAAWAVKVLRTILPADLPRQEGVGIDGPVLWFALAAVTAVALSLGLFSAWRAGRGDLQEALAAGARGTSGAGASQRLRGFLVVGEIAITLVILVGAGLLGRSFLRLIATSPGFRAEGLITMEFKPAATDWQAKREAMLRQIHLLDDVMARLRRIPGAESVGLTGQMPVAHGDDLADGTFLLLHGHRAPASFEEFGQMAHDPSQTGYALYAMAGADYFRTVGIPLVRGRMFGAQDDYDAPHAAVISESLARRRWPGEDPVGQEIEFGNMDGNLKPLTIVGIVGDVRAEGLDAPASSIIYVNYRQRGLNPNSAPTILVRSAAPASQIVPAARSIFHDLAPDVPVEFSTFENEMGGWLADRRFLLLLVGVFAAAALALASVGIYGVVAFAVTRRTQEIGIRMALGAQRGQVLRMVVGEGARLATLGVALGIAVSLLVTRFFASLLFGVRATDPATFASVAVLLTLVVLAASYIPARRAMRLDPGIALRYE